MEPVSNTSQKSASTTDKQNSSDERQLVEYHAIEETPFTAAKVNDKWHLLMGKYNLEKTPFNTREECEEAAKDLSWFRLMQVMKAVADDSVRELCYTKKETGDLIAEGLNKLHTRTHK